MFKQGDEGDMAYSPVQHSSPDEVETVVGPSVVVEGDFASEGNILVKGTVSGSVKTGRLLTVEEGAKILADVQAGEAMISGEVKGSVIVQDQLELSETAKVYGDVSCRVLVVAPGAHLEGQVSMGGSSASAPKKKARRARKADTSEAAQSQGEE